MAKVTIGFKCDPTLKQIMLDEAAERGVTLSEYAEEICENRHVHLEQRKEKIPKQVIDGSKNPFHKLYNEVRGRFADDDTLFDATVSEPLRTILLECREQLQSDPEATPVPYDSPGFMVLVKSGQRPPKYIHPSIDLAMAEAERLAVKVGSDAMLLKVVGHVRTDSFTETRTYHEVIERKAEGIDYANDDDLPF